MSLNSDSAGADLPPLGNNRVLVIDDNRAIHEDFRKILTGAGANRSQLEAAAAGLFGVAPRVKKSACFRLESAFQGKDGVALAEKALAAGQPFAMAFVDMRMPPGWDGLETMCRLWELQPDLQIVLCTAHSDYSLDQIQEKVEVADRLLILKKPFDTVEVLQLAQALTEKWRLGQLAARQTAELTREVDERTAELKQANQVLWQQARLINLAHDAISACDLNGCVEFWNTGAEQLFGWSSREMVGASLIDRVFSYRTLFEEPKQPALLEGEWSGELTLTTKSGAEVIVRSRWTLVRDEAGQPKSILLINSDITEQKKMEQQFLRAQRMESIGTLASGVAHDLNNILSPILMCAPMLREEMDREQMESLVSTIETSATRGAQIVRQVLTFGRGFEGERQPVDLGVLIKEIVQITSETFPKGVRIRCEVAPGLWKIIGDQTQWHQVLLNLSVNARDAMPQGGELTFRASNLQVDAHYASMQPGLSPGPHVLVEASDTGSGISSEVVERIFDPFFTTKAIGHGTGLGLSTAMGIVKSHGGAIELVSTTGRGTTFRILVPATTSPVRLEADGEPAVRYCGQGETVLIVDDEEGIRQVAQTVLERNGYKTMLACDGPEALAVFAKHSQAISAVLTDLMMPYMDGVALVRAFQKLRPHLALIASTGQSDKARVAELRALGVETILDKPYTGRLLLEAIHRALHPSNGSDNGKS